jgi:hypothetical protein
VPQWWQIAHDQTVRRRTRAHQVLATSSP